MLEIRQERVSDRQEVFQVVLEAFSHAEHSDGNEQELVKVLRATPSFIQELSLVAVEDGRIVGHILFTKITIGAYTELALAPLGVLPAYQRRGIGLALIREGHRAARQLGYDYSVVLGSPAYYPKAGYLPASRFGIKAPFAVRDENFMAFKLRDDAPPVKGVVKYDPAFGIN